MIIQVNMTVVVALVGNGNGAEDGHDDSGNGDDCDSGADDGGREDHEGTCNGGGGAGSDKDDGDADDNDGRVVCW